MSGPRPRGGAAALLGILLLGGGVAAGAPPDLRQPPPAPEFLRAPGLVPRGAPPPLVLPREITVERAPVVFTRPTARWCATILMQFPDRPALPQSTPDYFRELLFRPEGVGPLYPYGSMNQFYVETSGGMLQVTGAVTDWFTAPAPASAYADLGQNCGYNCLGSVCGFGLCTGAQQFVKDAVEAAAEAGFDFSRADNGSGEVDCLLVFHSGPGGDQTLTDPTNLYSHYNCADAPITYVSGKAVRCYEIMPEESVIPAPAHSIDIGVIAHEFGHSLGLVDLYDREHIPGFGCTPPGSAAEPCSYGLGNYSLMSYAAHGPDPNHLTAYERSELGWAVTTPVTKNLCQTSLRPDQDVLVVPISGTYGSGGGEYYMVEYRPPVGFDHDLPGLGTGATTDPAPVPTTDGILIYHVEESMGLPLTTRCSAEPIALNDCPCLQFPDCVNNPAVCSACGTSHMLLSLVQADGTFGLETGADRGDAYDYYIPTAPGFDSGSCPASRDYACRDTSIAVGGLRKGSDGSMRVDVVVDPTQPMLPPRIGTAPPGFVPAGATVGVAFRAQGVPPISWALGDGSPPWIYLDPATGYATVAPPLQTEAAAYSFFVYATNCKGDDRIVWNLTVGPGTLESLGRPSPDCLIGSLGIFRGRPDKLAALRGWRDGVLARSAPGRALIRAYYALGRRLVPFLERHPRAARALARLLAPVLTALA